MPSQQADSDLVHALQERIKELSCLYEISNIAATSLAPLEQKLQEVVNALPKAWQHPEYAVAELIFDGRSYRSGSVGKNRTTQQHPITIRQRERGHLAMHYTFDQGGLPSFLHEEELLLRTLAQEISGIIERDEQREREALLRRKFEQADRLTILGEITAGIAHELNTPLGNILGFAQLIQDRADDRQIAQDVEKIINSAVHSREIVKKLMFFACEMPQQKQQVSVTSLVEEALQLLRVTFKNAAIEPIFQPPSIPLNAQVDPIQFTQVVFNLLINALHASKAGQSIIIELSKEGEELRLRIQDFGHGIQEEVRERIFEPFFSTKPPGEGSGLGLSVVHGIVRSHGGRIEVESQAGEGASFSVFLPLNTNE
jgi:signal transduction histidine kinase